MPAALETHQLTRRFRRTEAIRDLSFTVPDGSICALLGPNGAGKTTTIKLLMNLLRPSEGGASVLGRDSRRLDAVALRRIGYVSEKVDTRGDSDDLKWSRGPEWFADAELVIVRSHPAGSVIRTLDIPDFPIQSGPITR